MIGMAIVVLPLAVVALSLPRWFDRAELGRAVAQDVARTVARSVDLESGLAASEALVAAAAKDAGLSSGPTCGGRCITFRVEGDLERGRQITATVTVDMPGIFIPFAGTIGGATWSAVHAERVDDYRSLP
jgi:hypothetical protein